VHLLYVCVSFKCIKRTTTPQCLHHVVILGSRISRESLLYVHMHWSHSIPTWSLFPACVYREKTLVGSTDVHLVHQKLHIEVLVILFSGFRIPIFLSTALYAFSSVMPLFWALMNQLSCTGCTNNNFLCTLNFLTHNKHACLCIHAQLTWYNAPWCAYCTFVFHYL
jgi:hypothetical protein